MTTTKQAGVSSDAVVFGLVPGDKSVGIRALLVALVADGPSRIRNLADCRITETTIAALRTLGAVVDVTVRPARGVLAGGIDVVVTPPASLRADAVVDCRGSATLARLLLGVLAGKNVAATVVGSEMLSRRPMARVAEPLAVLFGRPVVALSDGRLPATIIAGPPPTSHDVVMPGDSAQVRAAVMLAALTSARPVTLWSARPGRRHTEQLLRWLGVDVVDDDAGSDGRPRRTRIAAVDSVPALDLDVPGDPSAAAFLEVFAALLRRRPLDIVGVLDDDERTGLSRTLRRMQKGGGLRGVVVGAADIPDMVDEIPILAAACAGASSPSTIRGLAELRVKESDRLARIVDLLAAFGVDVNVDGDDIVIVPGPWRAPTAPIVTDRDHRIGMTALVMAAVIGVDVELDDTACVDDSWRGFAAQLAAVAEALRSADDDQINGGSPLAAGRVRL